jgi:serine O-acetyltransferase
LRLSREVANNIRHRGLVRELPSREAVDAILEDLCAALFPTHFGQTVLTDDSIDYFVGSSLDRALTALREQVRRGLQFAASPEAAAGDLQQRAREIVREFAQGLPAVRALLVSDLRAALRGDPAANSIAEILLCYRGAMAVIHHRLAHSLHRLGAGLIARLISDIAHAATGIDIHPGAEIGESFFIDHGTGVVIGETAIIGSNVRIYQAVTLGAKRFPAAADGTLVKGAPRHPIIEDNVVIYAGATILGRITVGRDSVIGGNVWLTHSVPAGSIITQAQAQNG